MRQDQGSSGSIRSSALWGGPASGEGRSSALWGKGGRGLLVLLTVILVSAGAVDAAAAAGKQNRSERAIKAYLSPGLQAAAEANPDRVFDVIVQGNKGEASANVASDVTATRREHPGRGAGLRRSFRTVSAVAAQLTGKQIMRLARRSDIRAITSDSPVLVSSHSNDQRWAHVANLSAFWNTPSGHSAPTIAIVDSGIDAGRADFGDRIVADVNLASIAPNSPGDGRGHGTFVAGIAAGGSPGYTGGSPGSNIVSIDVMDDQGMAMTRDVIAAADWILANRNTYNIRVANFSLHASTPASVFYDPLDLAVEKLWFAGIVVVTAAGNYNVDGDPTTVAYAPGNDPFVITVGAADTAGTLGTEDDFAAPWSVYGHTIDGFAKPDLGAPGRYLVGPVPASSTLPSERPESVVESGYMQLSGTSFAAPMVAAAAAHVLAVNPDWTPDQVKGALMLTARETPSAAPGSLGVGMVDAAAAAAVEDPPNPNAALNEFVSGGGESGTSAAFNAASWASTAESDASWASASWASASWASASWASASWASASWSSASWASASWASASWASASWATNDNADGDMNPAGEYLSPEERSQLGLAP